ncbi:hypothetical protein [Acidimangrovimonas pyrenivorans]|uniref:Sulfotransferase family protein n=1 Tax=Acidimangrovimonas pyrenivorans TaxID=2030798 RepID=A0ABV7AMP9_9RHOB
MTLSGSGGPGPARTPSAPGNATRRIVFLHIGKTGGTALRGLLRAQVEATGQRPFRILSHSVTLAEAAAQFPHAELGFFIRDPLDRLVSGFVSRQRRGRPRFDIPWSAGERAAFSRYDSPDALGRALARDEPEALAALAAIQHTRDGLAHFLGGPELLDRLVPRLGFIGATESFDTDIARLKRRLGLAPELEAPRDPVGAHRSPAAAPPLSEPARAALTAWLAPDYAVHAWCTAWRARHPD